MYYCYVDNESKKKAIQLKEEDKTKVTAESNRKKLQIITDSEQSRPAQEAERRAEEGECSIWPIRFQKNENLISDLFPLNFRNQIFQIPNFMGEIRF